MLINKLVWLNDPTLKSISQPVLEIDDSVRQLVQTMFDVIDEIHDTSLAAIQLGVPKRVIVLDMLLPSGEHFRQALINPEIVAISSDQHTYTEFCSSIPNHEFPTKRADSVQVRYLDMEEKQQEINAQGIFAVCLQHEIDHLNGVLISDHLSQLKLGRLKNQLAKLRKQAR